MKIKEVCARTGLTEKSVRYYTECGLCEPERIEIRGRVYSDFTAENIAQLKRVITLRGVGLSIEHIKEIKSGGDIDKIMTAHTEALRQELERKQEVFKSLSELDYSAIEGIEALTSAVRQAGVKVSAPDFSRFEDISVYGGSDGPFDPEGEARYQRGKRQALMVSFVLIISTMVAVMSVHGILMFLAAALVFLHRRSGYLMFYRIIAFLGLVANTVSALSVRSDALDEAYIQLTAYPTGFWVYIIIAAVDFAALAALYFGGCLKEHLRA